MAANRKKTSIRKKRRRKTGFFLGTQRGMIEISFVVLLFLVVMLVGSGRLKVKNAGYEEQLKELNTEIEKQVQRGKEIEDLQAYMNSQEYLEQAAREKLGMVYEDEIVFRAK